MKKQREQNSKRLSQATNKVNNLDNRTKKVNDILNELKPSKLNKNNMVISNENVQGIKKLTEEIKRYNWSS